MWPASLAVSQALMDLASEYPQEARKDCCPCFFMMSAEQWGELNKCWQLH